MTERTWKAAVPDVVGAGVSAGAGPVSLLRLAAARPRLVLLYLLATGPLLLLLGLGAWVDRSNALWNAQQEAEATAHAGARKQTDIMLEARNLLTVLALVPDIRDGGAACHEQLRLIGAQHQRINDLRVVRPDGVVACNSRDEALAADLRDHPYFQHALRSPGNGVAGDDIVTNPATGFPSIVVSMPVRAADNGPVQSVLTATLGLEWLPGIADGLNAGHGMTVQLIDRVSGTILLVADQQGVRAASSAADPVLLSAIRAAPEGGSTHGLLAGAGHTVGFAPLRTSGSTMVLAAFLPQAQTLAASNYHLTLNALGFLAAAIAAVVLAWLAADYSLLRPIKTLAAAATVIGEGKLATRIGDLPGAVDELKTLAGRFNEMAENLRARDASIAALNASIAQSEEHHRLLANNAGDMIARFDGAFTHTYVSPACREVLGYLPDLLVGRTLQSLVLDDDRARVQAELISPLRHGADTARATYRAMHRDGRPVWIESFIRRLPDGSGFVTVARDVTIQKALEAELEVVNQQLRVQVMQDPLTGISNRRRFDEMLGFEYQRSQRMHEPLSLLMIDIDHFKQFNDTYGHPAGDECLRAVATALEQTLRRPGDLVGRYGGEEFAVLLPGTPLAGAIIISERIRAAVSAVALPGAPGALTVSIGGATILPPIDTDGPADLIRSADVALYQAKREGRDCVKMAALDRLLDAAHVG